MQEARGKRSGARFRIGHGGRGRGGGGGGGGLLMNSVVISGLCGGDVSAENSTFLSRNLTKQSKDFLPTGSGPIATPCLPRLELQLEGSCWLGLTHVITCLQMTQN